VIQTSFRARSERASGRPSGQVERTLESETEVTERVLGRLAGRVGSGEVERYFPRLANLLFKPGKVEVRARTGFVAQQMRTKLLSALNEVAKAEFGAGIVVEFVSEGSPVALAPDRIAGSMPPGTPALRTRAAAGPSPAPAGRYRLEDFIVGESNKLAFTAAERLADVDCPRGFNLLFLHGSCGVGKTHLVQGIAARYRDRHPGATVRCVTGEVFTNAFITALKSGKIEAFRREYRDVDLLCIDDVHFLQSKDATQEEMLHTFNAIDLTGARVVLASDEHPRNVRKLSDALVSRFLSGMVVKVDLPEPALRERIVRTLAERRGMRIEPSAASLIASRCGGLGTQSPSVRDIEGALTRIDGMRGLLPELSTGPEIGLALVRKALGLSSDQAAGSRARRPIRIQEICDCVCRTLGVQLDEVLGRSKHARVVLARTLCAYLARQMTTMSFPEIARALGRSNHSTVVTASQRFERQLGADQAVALGMDPGPDLSGLSLRALFERLRDEIQRSASLA
jgi:chromosomal replication initiator protein